MRELPYLRRGTYSTVALLYSGPPSDYLSEQAREAGTKFINGPGAVFLNDKLALHQALAEAPALRPELLGVVADGRASRPDGTPCRLAEIVEKASKVVVRPAAGARGKGLLFVEADCGNGLLVNGEAATGEQLDALQPQLAYHLLTRFVEQHSYAAAIYPNATNTIRVLILREPASGEPFLAAGCHRFGTERSGHVDNFSAGGLSASIDLATGRLGRATRKPKEHRPPRWYSSHPDTRERIEGVVIPGWDAIRAALEKAMALLPMVRQVGWDVMQTPEGPKLIEGNNQPDANLHQVHGGLLRDERVRRFYEHHRVIPPPAAGGESAG